MQKTRADRYHPLATEGKAGGGSLATEDTAVMSAKGSAAAAGIAATDTELVAGVRAGDDLAFEELYRRYQRRISSFVRRVLRDEARAEDVTQEAFVSALRRLRATTCE